MTLRRSWAGVAVVAVLVLGGCGSSDDANRSSTDETVASSTTSTTPLPPLSVKDSTSGPCRSAEDAAKAEPPEIDAPTAPAAELGAEDLIAGCGEAISADAPVEASADYLILSQTSGKVATSTFDVGRPDTLPVSQAKLPPGFDHGLGGMKVGGRRVLTIPGNLAFGDRGSQDGSIAPNDTIVFVIDLLGVTHPPEITRSTAADAPKDCRSGDDAKDAGAPNGSVPDTPSADLRVIDDVVGCGEAIPEGVVVQATVNYEGRSQSSGKVFDTSFDRGEPATFAVGAGRVIQGWDQGLVGMKVGGRRTLVIPGSLAYGPEGRPPDIGPNDTLVFVIDLVAISQ